MKTGNCSPEPDMFSETKVALSAAIIIGVACLSHPSRAIAQTASPFESEGWVHDWVVQGDPWIHRHEPASGNLESGSRRLAPANNGERNSPEQKPQDY